MITEAERKLYDWQYDLSGSFFKGLFNIIAKADTKNLAKLKLGFPEEVIAVTRYKSESGYWEDVKLRMKLFQSSEFNVPDVSKLEVKNESTRNN